MKIGYFRTRNIASLTLAIHSFMNFLYITISISRTFFIRWHGRLSHGGECNDRQAKPRSTMLSDGRLSTMNEMCILSRWTCHKFRTNSNIIWFENFEIVAHSSSRSFYWKLTRYIVHYMYGDSIIVWIKYNSM